MANRRYNTQVTNDRACMSKGGSTSEYHTTKEGKKAKKGLWYNIAMKRKRGEKMRKKFELGGLTKAQKTLPPKLQALIQKKKKKEKPKPSMMAMAMEGKR